MNANYSYMHFEKTMLGIMGTSSIVTQNCEIQDIYFPVYTSWHLLLQNFLFIQHLCDKFLLCTNPQVKLRVCLAQKNYGYLKLQCLSQLWAYRRSQTFVDMRMSEWVNKRSSRAVSHDHAEILWGHIISDRVSLHPSYKRLLKRQIGYILK